MPPLNPVESQGMRLLRQLLLRGKRIFTMKEAKIAAQLEKIPAGQLNKILFNLTIQGRLLRLRRELYVSIGLLSGPNPIHPFVVSAFLTQPSAISYWSALQYHGLTEQIPQIITASTPNKIITPSMRKKSTKGPRQKHTFEIAGICYEYTTIKKEHFNIGLERIWLDEHFQVMITDKERTLLDVFIYPKIFGGLGEALGILENSLPNINVPKLIGYAIEYGKKSLAKRLGWALEYFGVPVKDLAPLLEIPINYYCRLDPSAPTIGLYDKRWMIQNNLKGKQK